MSPDAGSPSSATVATTSPTRSSRWRALGPRRHDRVSARVPPTLGVLAARDLAESTARYSPSCTTLAPRDGADAVYADVWASMGEEGEREGPRELLAPYQETRT